MASCSRPFSGSTDARNSVPFIPASSATLEVGNETGLDRVHLSLNHSTGILRAVNTCRGRATSPSLRRHLAYGALSQ